MANKLTSDFVIAFADTTIIRDAPSTQGKIVGKEKRGTRFQFAGLTSGKWLMIEYKGNVAWTSEAQSILID